MTVTIVSSVIASQNVQKDGRVAVHEVHTDSLGVVYTFDYLNDGSINTAAHLANDAASILPQAAAAEVANNLTTIASQGMYAPAVTVYSTSAQNVAALQAAWPNYTNTQAIYTGEYLNALSDAQLEAAFGWSPAVTANYRTTYFAPYATIAAAIRAATGALF